MSRLVAPHVTNRIEIHAKKTYEIQRSMLPSPVRTLVHCVADLLTSSHPQMSASHLLGLQVRANRPSQLSYQSTCIVTWGATNQDMLLYRKSRIWGCYKLRYVTKQEILLLAILLYLFAVYKCLHGKYFNTQCLARPSYIG